MRSARVITLRLLIPPARTFKLLSKVILVHNGGKIADLAETIGRKAYLWIGFLSSQLWAIFSVLDVALLLYMGKPGRFAGISQGFQALFQPLDSGFMHHEQPF